MSRKLLRSELNYALHRYMTEVGTLPGLRIDDRRGAFLEQLVDSERRNQYYARILQRNIRQDSGDPTSTAFNPLRAAVLFERNGNRDEAFWMVLLSVHFGKSLRSGWRLVADVYGRLGVGGRWSWNAVSTDAVGFRTWLVDSADVIKSLDPPRRFGNHRKYESLDGQSPNGTGAAVASYVQWVGHTRSHDARLTDILSDCEGDPRAGFQALYRSVKRVRRVGRTGAYDYCSTASKLGLLPIVPAMAGLSGASGPLSGARLLLGPLAEGLRPSDIEDLLVPLQQTLGIGFDALEDALCNWQKSPDKFMPFRG